eukprot:scaffold267624_cov22-Tisochrysis_lutea.AAC.2
MSMRTMASSESKSESASALANSVLPTPVGPRKRSDAAGARALDRLSDRLDRLLLARDTSTQPIAQLEDFLSLGAQHLLERHAGPLRDDSRNVLLAHSGASEATIAARRGAERVLSVLRLLQLPTQLWKILVLELGRTIQLVALLGLRWTQKGGVEGECAVERLVGPRSTRARERTHLLNLEVHLVDGLFELIDAL